MKKSKAITLVLVTGLLGCHNKKTEHNRLYMRTDTTGSYSAGTAGYHGYYIFRPYGMYYGAGGGFYGGRGGYVRQGYANSGIRSSSSGNVSRGGFGRTGGFHASSSS